jgi:23S rRNA (guanosine2251-2'-O)-methyltransferase
LSNRKLRNIELNRPSVEEFKNQEKFPIVVVLDNVRSMHNVGSVFRTSDAFNVDEIALCGITAKPPHREITKAAIGAERSVSWSYHENTARYLTQLKEEGYLLLGVEQMEKSISLENFAFDKKNKYALVMGNEVDGIHEEVIPLIDTFLEVPQFGTKHSLNISVCTGVVLWHAVSTAKFHKP